MSEAAAPAMPARFVSGSTMRHVAVMTFTGALGLMAMFLVDLLDLFYLSLLGRTEVTAAIGYAGIIAFANLSMSIGTGIAAAALVARNLGARDSSPTPPSTISGGPISRPGSTGARRRSAPFPSPGTALGSVVFGLASAAAAYRIVGRMAATTA
jgi:hypothetical protein